MPDAILDPKTMQYISHSQIIALGLVGISILAVIGWKMMISSIENADKGSEGKGWDIMGKARIIAIGAVVGMYATLATPIVGSLVSLSDAFRVGSTEWNKIDTEVKKQQAEANGTYEALTSKCSGALNYASGNSTLAKMVVNDLKSKGMSDGEICNYLSTLGKMNTEEGILDAILRILNYLTTGEIFAVLVHTIVSIFAALIKYVMFYVVLYTMKVLLILGPIAWAVSIFDFSRDQWKVHLHFTLNTGFIFVVLNILDAFMIFNHQQLDSYSAANGNIGNMGVNMGLSMMSSHQWEQIGFDLAMIGLYLQAGTLASAAIGKNITSGIANSAAAIGGLAVAAAGAAMGAAVGAAAGGGAGASKGSKMGGSLGDQSKNMKSE